MIERRADTIIAGGGYAGSAAAKAFSLRGRSVIMLDRMAPEGWEIFDAGPGPRVRAMRGEELLEVEAEHLVIATGARELFLPFPGWTLPGVFGAGGLQNLVKSGLRVSGKRVVVAGSGPLLLAAAGTLIEHGAHVIAVCEQAPLRQMWPFAAAALRNPARWGQAAELALTTSGRFRASTWVNEAEGREHLEAVRLNTGERIVCDALACGFGLVPNTELAELLGCRMENGFVAVNQWLETSVAGVFCIGEPAGIGGREQAVSQGSAVGHGKPWRGGEWARVLAESFRLRNELRQLPDEATVVCRCEDVRWSELRGCRDARHAKLQTRCGMGSCQARVCGAALAFLKGWKHPGWRPPVAPVKLGTLAGDRQKLML